MVCESLYRCLCLCQHVNNSFALGLGRDDEDCLPYICIYNVACNLTLCHTFIEFAINVNGHRYKHSYLGSGSFQKRIFLLNNRIFGRSLYVKIHSRNFWSKYLWAIHMREGPGRLHMKLSIREGPCRESFRQCYSGRSIREAIDCVIAERGSLDCVIASRSIRGASKKCPCREVHAKSFLAYIISQCHVLIHAILKKKKIHPQQTQI